MVHIAEICHTGIVKIVRRLNTDRFQIISELLADIGVLLLEFGVEIYPYRVGLIGLQTRDEADLVWGLQMRFHIIEDQQVQHLLLCILIFSLPKCVPHRVHETILVQLLHGLLLKLTSPVHEAIENLLLGTLLVILLRQARLDLDFDI